MSVNAAYLYFVSNRKRKCVAEKYSNTVDYNKKIDKTNCLLLTIKYNLVNKRHYFNLV